MTRPGRLVKSRSSLWHKLIVLAVILILLIVGGVLVSILIFGHSSNGAGDRLVELKIDGKQLINSLEDTQYTISLANQEISDLKSAELEADFPRGFVLDNVSQPCKEKLVSGCTWMLGKVARGESRTITLNGYFLEASANEGDLKTLKAQVNFQLQDFSSLFQKSFEQKVFVNPILSAEVDGPTNLIPDQNYNWQIKIHNNSNQKIVQTIRVEPGANASGFSASTVPNQKLPDGVTYGDGFWNISGMDPQGETDINFLLSISSINASSSSLTVPTSLGFLTNDGYFLQQEVDQSITAENIINLSLSVGGAQTNFKVGDSLPVVLSYDNIAADIKNFTLSLVVSDDQLIDKAKLINTNWQWQSPVNNFSGNKWSISGNTGSTGSADTLYWTSLQIPSFAGLTSTDSGQISLVFNLNFLPAGLGSQSLTFQILAGGTLADNSGNFNLVGPSKTITINP